MKDDVHHLKHCNQLSLTRPLGMILGRPAQSQYAPCLYPDRAETRMLLVNDIMTTGETVRECSRILAQGGAEDIQFPWSAAHDMSNLVYLCQCLL